MSKTDTITKSYEERAAAVKARFNELPRAARRVAAVDLEITPAAITNALNYSGTSHVLLGRLESWLDDNGNAEYVVRRRPQQTRRNEKAEGAEAFVDAFLEEDPDASTEYKDVYAAYVSWCLSTNRYHYGAAAFQAYLRDVMDVLVATAQGATYVHGYRLAGAADAA